MATPKQNSIYKVNILNIENKVESIHVFYGNVYKNNVNLEELFKKDPKNELFFDNSSYIFNDDELRKIMVDKIPVYFSFQQLHTDDNILSIKIKVTDELNTSHEKYKKSPISLSELYLFGLIETTLNPTNIYSALTEKKQEITKQTLDLVLLNIVDNSEFDIPKKSSYTYDDILSLDLTEQTFLITRNLGQSHLLIADEYPYIGNPFLVKSYNDTIEKQVRKSMLSLNTLLLMNTGVIYNNNIYVCSATDVLEYNKLLDLNQETAIKIYYPNLLKDDIVSLDTLNSKREMLIDKSKDLFDDDVFDNFKNVDMFYDIYKERTQELNYKTAGIHYIKVMVKPTYDIKIRLDVIFKLVHADIMKPLIKFNPSVKQENIYRLYTDSISIDGRKIPYLSRATIFKLIKSIGKTKSVTVYIEYKISKKQHVMLCEFDEYGNVFIEGEFEKATTMADIESLIKKMVNPIIDDVKTYIEKSGYSINYFEGFTDKNVEIKHLNYETTIEIERSINLDKLKACLSSIFVVESSNLKTGIEMRFKRVSNFSKTNSQEAFIIEKQKQKYTLLEIIEGLMENYKMTENDAKELLQKVANELEVVKGVRKSEIEIKINPGFKTRIELNKNTGVITISVDGINNNEYLTNIPIYLDTLIRLTQDMKSTNYPVKQIKNNCSGGELKTEIILKDFEKEEIDQQKMFEQKMFDLSSASSKSSSASIKDADYKSYIRAFNEEEDEEYNQEKKERNKTAFDLFYGDSSESGDEEEKISGGKSSSKSSSNSNSETFKEGEILDFDIPEDEPVEKNKIVIGQPLYPGVDDDDIEDIEKNVIELDGMSLKNPNVFEQKLQQYDPTLFLTKKQGKFKPYSRTCASNLRKQPVLLTKEEFEKIKKNKPGFLKPEDVLKYGSDPKKPNYYICPRYWCLKTNTPIDPAELKEVRNERGEIVKKHPTCGEVIPRDAKAVPKGAYIYEFFDPQEHGTQDKYIQHYPGFMKEGLHPDDLCIPCCFKKWNTKEHIGKKAKCEQQMEADVEPVLKESVLDYDTEAEDSENEEDTKNEVKNMGITQNPQQIPSHSESQVSDEQIVKRAPGKEKEDFYIKGQEKVPLDAGRWGYLPISIQHFLHEDNSKCQNQNKQNVRYIHSCLLRHGVEFSETQSFIACIADIMFYIDSKNIPSIKQMKELILSSLSIDDFLTYQNGNLYIDFDIEPFNISEELVEKYMNSKIYQATKHNLDFFYKIVSSFENFKAFLMDNTVNIDYTYLWDIICRPNPTLFSAGINLIILEVDTNDVTDSVNLICPTNHYSSEIFDHRKYTYLIVKSGNYYEPIYSYKNVNKKLTIIKKFSELNPELPANIRNLFKKIIKPYIHTMCKPLNSMPLQYKFSRANLLNNVITNLQKIKYTIVKQIINFEGKVIGVIASNETSRGFIPCYPSSINNNYDFILVSKDIFTDYKNTIRFLREVYKSSKKVILCNPLYKVVDKNKLVVGILTETNNFVGLIQYVNVNDTNDDSLILIEGSDLYKIDNKIILNDKIDEERIETIQRIKMETNLYNSFRNTIRILLNDFKNIKQREKIEKEANSPYALYNEQLDNISQQLRKLVDDKVLFTEDYDIGKINKNSNISACMMNAANKCLLKNSCKLNSQNNMCELVIPKYNLINKSNNNEEYYYDKMADEIIRYNRIKSFMFEPQTYLSFNNLGYNLTDNEVVMIQSLLTSEYFDTLVPAVLNKYVKYNNYDTVEPQITQVYDNRIQTNDTNINIDADNELVEYVPKMKDKITSGVWKKSFPSSYSELSYDNGFYLLIDIIKKATSQNLTMNQIRLDLLHEYASYFKQNGDYENKILDVLALEGKKILVQQVREKLITFTNFIYNGDYFISNLDVCLILQKYKIPSFFISTKPICQNKYTNNAYVIYGETNEKFCFIVTSPLTRGEKTSTYKLVQNDQRKIFIEKSVLRGEGLDNVDEALDNKQSMSEFLNIFTKKEYSLKNKGAEKPKVKLVIEEDSDNEIEA
uniref:Uncharacterized protein n=1 Tax=viral metagenome TaxID=1070528 RepID=A0A6C0DF74_9ZZZZ